MKKNLIIKSSILVASIMFIFIGLFRKEQGTVIAKAINVCLECIGVG